MPDYELRVRPIGKKWIVQELWPAPINAWVGVSKYLTEEEAYAAVARRRGASIETAYLTEGNQHD